MLAREHGDLEKAWRTILELVDGDVSLETTEPEASAMYEQGKHLASLGENAIVKVPMTPAGIKCDKRLSEDGIRINVTLVFSPAQAILPPRFPRTSPPPSSAGSTMPVPTA